MKTSAFPVRLPIRPPVRFGNLGYPTSYIMLKPEDTYADTAYTPGETVDTFLKRPEDPLVMVINTPEALDEAWQLTNQPPEDKPAIDFSRQSLLFVARQQGQNHPIAMNKLTYHRRKDELEIGFWEPSSGRSPGVAWNFYVLTNGMPNNMSEEEYRRMPNFHTLNADTAIKITSDTHPTERG